MRQCTTSSGVILAVDFSRWGGPLLRSCGTTPTTGYQLLNQGGWRTTGTQHDGPAFICRIGYAGHQGGTQYPTPSGRAVCSHATGHRVLVVLARRPGAEQLGLQPTRRDELQAQAGQRRPVDLRGDRHRRHRGPAPIQPGQRPRPQQQPDRRDHHRSGPRRAHPGSAGRRERTGRRQPAGAGQPRRREPSTRPPGGGSTGVGAGQWRADASGHRGGTSGTGGAVRVAERHAPTDPDILDAAPTATAARQDTGSALPALITVGLLALLALAGGVVGWRRRRT